jgi:hypothetical protein
LNTELVLFLGAGFSRAAGHPLMREFPAETSWEITELVKRHGTLDRSKKGFRYAAPQLIEAAYTFEAFRELCRVSSPDAGVDWDNLETVYGVAEALLEAKSSDIQLGDQWYSVESIVRDIQFWIWKVYQRLPVVQSTPERPVDRDAYDRFFSLMVKLKLGSSTTVITTNYDLTYEFLSWENELPCAYPLSWPDAFSVNRQPSPYVFPRESSEGKTLVCKLHGSVNYFENEGMSGARDIYVAADLGGGSRVGNSGPVEGRPALLGLDSIWVLQRRYGSGITPAIVPPSYAKLGRRRWLNEIWHAALEVLRSAKRIVFIGYSLPASDGFMSALLSGAAAVRAGTSPATVFVVDPSESSYRRIAAVYRGTSVKWIAEDFATATETSLVDVLSAI